MWRMAFLWGWLRRQALPKNGFRKVYCVFVDNMLACLDRLQFVWQNNRWRRRLQTTDSKQSEYFNTGRHNPHLQRALSGWSKPAPTPLIFRTFLKQSLPKYFRQNHPRKRGKYLDLLQFFWSNFSPSLSSRRHVCMVTSFRQSGWIVSNWEIRQSYLHEHRMQ